MTKTRFPLVVVLGVVLLAACQKESVTSGAPGTPVARTGGACQLEVGWDPWEPYQYEDADGSMRGLDVEIVRDLARTAGCDVAFTRGTWKDLLAGLRQGSVDILMGATSTPEREQYAAFSPSYRRETFALLTRAADAETLGTMDVAALARAGKRIGVTEGYYYGEAVTALMQNEATRFSFVHSPVVELSYTHLLEGDVDALLDDPLVAAAVLRRKGIGGRIVRNPSEITSGNVSFMYSRVGVPEDTVKKLNDALVARKADGTLARLIEKYQGGLMAAAPRGGGSGRVAAPR